MPDKMSTTNSSEQGPVPERASIDESKIAYQRPQPFGMVPDAFVGSALDLDGNEREWVPQSPTVSFKETLNNNRLGLRSAQWDDSGAVVHWLCFPDDRRRRDRRAVCGHQRPVG